MSCTVSITFSGEVRKIPRELLIALMVGNVTMADFTVEHVEVNGQTVACPPFPEQVPPPKMRKGLVQRPRRLRRKA